MSVQAIETVAVVDDDLLQAESLGELLKDAGYKPQILRGKFAEVTELISAIQGTAQAAVCDHRLSAGGMANFPGAEAAAMLMQRSVPALLITQFVGQDADVSIRRWRPWVPVVLSREETSERPEAITEGLTLCIDELVNGRRPDRRTQRCLVRIESIGWENERVLDVFLSGWHPSTAVRIPAASIPESLRELAQPDVSFIAEVNTEAEDAKDLFFENFTLAPEPAELSLTSSRGDGVANRKDRR
jgi:CheY-like chemotaxis protein